MAVVKNAQILPAKRSLVEELVFVLDMVEEFAVS